MTPSKPVLAVVSPFIDKRHGTERWIAEWTSRLSGEFDVHVYSQRVEDLDLTRLTWHRIPKIRGPHLVNFLWWLAANHLWRWRDRRFRGIIHDLVFTAGTNCLDADAISIHIVFAEFVRRVRSEMYLQRNSILSWPRRIHRGLYYRLIILLERHLYTQPSAQLILIARKTAKDLDRFYGPHDVLPVLYMGIDHTTFNPQLRMARRDEARRELGIRDEQFVLLLVGNDWRKKGLCTLLDVLPVLGDCQELRHAAVGSSPEDLLNHMTVREDRGLRPGGFGIMLAQKLVDELIYDEHGNDVILVKYLDPRATSAP